MRHDLLQKLQKSKKGAEDEHRIQKGTPYLQSLFMLAVGLTKSLGTPHPQFRNENFMASGRLLSAKSHSPNPRYHFGWQARSWNSKPRPQELFPLFLGKSPQDCEDTW